jgi:hypothetical protein
VQCSNLEFICCAACKGRHRGVRIQQPRLSCARPLLAVATPCFKVHPCRRACALIGCGHHLHLVRHQRLKARGQELRTCSLLDPAPGAKEIMEGCWWVGVHAVSAAVLAPLLKRVGHVGAHR